MVEPARQTVLMSIHPKYADRILDGVKRFEIRRRPVRVQPGDLVLVYASAPVKAIIGAFTVKRVHLGPAEHLWGQFAPEMGIERAAYMRYLEGADGACAIEVDATVPIANVDLAELRVRAEGFRPPQSYMFVDAGAQDALAQIAANAWAHVPGTVGGAKKGRAGQHRDRHPRKSGALWPCR